VRRSLCRPAAVNGVTRVPSDGGQFAHPRHGYIGQAVPGGSFLATAVLGAVGLFTDERLQKSELDDDD
jgi:hypothetical protein